MKALILTSFSALALFAVTACDGGPEAQTGGVDQETESMATTPTPETESDTAQ